MSKITQRVPYYAIVSTRREDKFLILDQIKKEGHLIKGIPQKQSYGKKVENIGLEPMTPCVQGRCSSQLS